MLITELLKEQMQQSCIIQEYSASQDMKNVDKAWPNQHLVDLSTLDAPQEWADLEWWYVHAHIKIGPEQREASLFAAFFRARASQALRQQRSHNFFLTWGLCDLETHTYHAHSLLDPRSTSEALEELNQGRQGRDERLAHALREMLDQGQLPLPDKLMTRPAQVATDRLDLDYDGQRLRKIGPSSYLLELCSDDASTGVTMTFELDKPLTRHGDQGIVSSLSGDDMFYYFCPKCCVSGEITLNGQTAEIHSGSAWYDHEFGEHADDREAHDGKVAWNWLAAQLDHGWELTVYDLFDHNHPERDFGTWAILIDPQGQRHAYQDFELVALDGRWRSLRTFNSYPTSWRLRIPSIDLVIEAHATLPQQELPTLLTPPGFWEGRVQIYGHHGPSAVSGLGFVERSGVSEVETLDSFFRAVSDETQLVAAKLLPAEPEPQLIARLFARAHLSHYADDVDPAHLHETLIAPIRSILMRGGKAWRSYALIGTLDAVGAPLEPYRDWLVLPELLHVGSLIVDDVQDRSELRRGGPACHVLYGEPLAINAGCAAYFIAELPLLDALLPEPTRRLVYEEYFAALRAAHVGQALDISSLARHIPAALEAEDASFLERHLHALHRLKSGAPPAALARCAVQIAGGDRAQYLAAGALFEAYGLAFQIVDDVLNVRGFQHGGKTRAEDLREGKCTAPIARALCLLKSPQRRELWHRVESKPQEDHELLALCDTLEQIGALESCMNQAREIIERAWSAFDPTVPASLAKMRLRAFGSFILDRHY
jgi:geranylgeranyl pyrophosphate synthase/predicted secreted hydrolase